MLYPLSYVPSTFFEYNTSCRKWLVDRANSIDRLQTAGPMRVLLARACIRQFSQPETANFDDYRQNNTTIDKIIDFDITKIRLTFDRGSASTTANTARINFL